MNFTRAKLKIKELKNICNREGNGFIGFIFADGQFTGAAVNMNKEECALVLKKVIETGNFTPNELMAVYKGGETKQ